MPADECEFFCMDYCLPPDYIVKAGFVCSKALPIREGDLTNKCGGNNEELMTEEEWEELREGKDGE
jgi:hypothetical protein